MTPRQLATTLAALRYYQSKLAPGSMGPLNDIATDGGYHKPLTAKEIDTLCESLNIPEDQLPTVVVTVEGGVVQSAVSDRQVKFAVIDYDVDQSDESSVVVKIPQGDGKTADAWAFRLPADIHPARAKELLSVVNRAERSSEQGPAR